MNKISENDQPAKPAKILYPEIPHNRLIANTYVIFGKPINREKIGFRISEPKNWHKSLR